MFSLKNKIAVITGGGSGIGRDIALLFAKQGAIIHIIELNSTAAAEVVNIINETGGIACTYSCNVANQKEVIAVFNNIGSINILVNNAGIAHIGKATTTEETDFDKVIKVNVKGVYNYLHAAIPQLQKWEGVSLSIWLL